MDLNNQNLKKEIQIEGNYRFVKKIGEGTYGIVFQAMD